MTISVDRLFATPIYRTTIPLSDNVLKHLEDISLVRASSNNLWQSGDKHIFKSNPELKEVWDQVDFHVKLFVYDVLKISKKIEFSCNGSWFNRLDPGDSVGQHYHTCSAINGVLYTKVDETSAPIVIHNNILRMNTFGPFFNFFDYDEDNDINSLFWRYKPTMGGLILFPSAVVHSIDTQESENVRESLAFDYMVHGRVDPLHATNSAFFSD